VKEIMAQKKCTFKEGLEWYNVHVEELKATEIKGQIGHRPAVAPNSFKGISGQSSQ